MPQPTLPAELKNSESGVTRTASTPGDYWDLVARGYTVEAAEADLTPQQKAARTRAVNKAKEEEQTSHDGNTQEPQAGTNAGDPNES